jgi:hypothetical protein
MPRQRLSCGACPRDAGFRKNGSGLSRLTEVQSRSCNSPCVATGGGLSTTMTTSAVLDDLIDALEAQSDSLFPFLDRETGEVLLISDESLSLSEAEPEEIDLLPDWQKEEAKLAVLIETTDRYLPLPTRFDVHEWNIMADFCHQVQRDDIRERLLGVIRGNQAFRRFKDQIATYSLWKEWNAFRREALAEIVRDWCEEEGIVLTVRQK